MTRTIYALLLRAYPPAYRASFEKEMLAVLQDAGENRSVLCESAGLLRGAAREWVRHFHREGKLAVLTAAVSGAAVAAVFHTLLYAALVPNAHAQGPQNRASAADREALEVVTALYRNTFAELHNAKTKEDIAKMVDDIDAQDWVSIDPYGFTVLTHDEEVRTLESFLSVPPDKRPSNTIEVLWIHAEPWRITAVDLVHSGIQGSAAMPAFRSKGAFGPNADSRFLLAGSLVRDTLARTPNGWRRIRHEKLLPDQFQQIQGDSVVSTPPAH